MAVLIIILIVIIVFLLIPVGASFRYEDNGIYLAVKAGPLKFQLLPKKEAEEQKKLKEKKPKKEKKRFDKEFIFSLARAAFKALGRIRRQISIDNLTLHWTASSDNPYDAAMQYGYISSMTGILIPLLDKALKIRNRDIKINIDFNAVSPKCFSVITATLQVWEWLYIAVVFAFKFLILKIKFRRQTVGQERKNKNGQTSRERSDGSDNGKAQRDGGC